MKKAKGLLTIDFDGTISVLDSIDTLLERYGADQKTIQDLEEQWTYGAITAFECVLEQVKQVSFSEENLNELIDSLAIDESFIDFYDRYKDSFSIAIVSDGMDNIIRPLLKKYGIEECPIYAGHLMFNKEKPMVSYPYHFDCPNGNGTCKCHVANNLNNFQTANRLDKIDQVKSFIHIGDGRSDFCIATKAQYVYAKDKLADFCKKMGISYTPFIKFSDIIL